ncbi:MAG: hypothetical protein RL336_777, partial [Pseudomonadota bacterium]
MRFGFLMLPLAMTIHLVSAAALADEDP